MSEGIHSVSGDGLSRDGASPTDPEEQNAWVIQSRLAAACRYNRWIHDLLDPYVGRRVLDAGCGMGNITQLFLDRELVVAMELRDDFCAFMRAHFGGHGNLEAVQGDLASDLSQLRTRRLDSVMCVNVLEHIEDDVGALAEFHAILEPAGRVALFTPAWPWLFGTMDAADHHWRRYTPGELRVKLERAGFAVEHQRSVNALGIAAWWVKGRLLRHTFVSEAGYGLFDHVVPLLAAVERLCPPPIGLSILSVGRK